MDLRDPQTSDVVPEPLRLFIDLNEIPSPPLDSPAALLDPLAVVRRYHDDPPPLAAPPAPFPGEPGLGPSPPPCPLCSLPELRGATIVCAACERGFHLSCTRIRACVAPALDEWACPDCSRLGLPSHRWPLGSVCPHPGYGGVRLLDINALPTSDGEGSDKFHGPRVHAPGEDSYSGISSNVQTPCSDVVCATTGFDPGNEPGTVSTSTVKSGSEETLPYDLPTSLEAATLGNANGGRSNDNDAIMHGSMAMQSESFLHALGEFISEKQGALREGCVMNFKQSGNGSCVQEVYCSPDGMRFDSMLDVARYLGLHSNCTSMDIEDKNDGAASLQRGSPMRRRRRKELARLSRASSSMENQDAQNNCAADLSPDVEMLEPSSCDIGSESRLNESALHGNSYGGSHHLGVELPVQYEDFFLLCLGEIDLRPSYHDTSQIWPVGYRSYWHDKITGSLFSCEVSDGGSYGPVFKVRRCPCSAVPIPNAATILSHPIIEKARNLSEAGDSKEKVEGGSNVVTMDCEEDYDIKTLLADNCLPQQDILTCLGSCLPEAFLGPVVHVGCADNLPAQLNSHLERADNFSGGSDQIGEFFVEGRSPSSVWSMVSQTLVDACRKVFRQSRNLQFSCNHECDRIDLASVDMKVKDSVRLLGKFCNSFGPIDIPHIVQSDDQLETACKSLAKWLDEDRFGLDVEFVEEIIEQLPKANACSRYEHLNKRCYSLSSQILVKDLLAKRRREEEESSGDLVRESKKARNEHLVELHDSEDHVHPPGRPLSVKVSAELVGDVVQVWETLWRFYEILGLKEPLSFEELIHELVYPWYDGPTSIEKLERKIQEMRDRNSQRTESMGVHALSLGESNSSRAEGRPVFIPVETTVTRAAAEAKAASRSYWRCTGVALTKAHTSLLKVLVGELLSKVVAFVDPDYDAGESKPKRGRKKDAESSVPLKKSKIDMLPINEFTWPELARRYILAFLALDGNLDSMEVAGREGGKVFRCLRGDGGILCGSLVGVAGMEADALLLAEAEKQISDSLKKEDEICSVEFKEIEATSGCETVSSENNNNLPEWAQKLEPVRKLPTNVGTRIRKCIFDALEKDPPEWARKKLEHSISKEVYKGNASGPTKKAVLSVLADVCGESQQQKPNKARKEKNGSSLLDVVTKQCRSVLRRALAADDGKVFCNLLGSTLINGNDNEDEGILGSPFMFSRPLDFRTVDLRLATGAYCGSHEAFLEDVREVWRNICIAYGDRSDIMQLAESLSKNFESLFDKEVISFVQQCAGYADSGCANEAVNKNHDDVVCCENEILKAPWEDGVCKVCGIDRDDDSVLLCDTCDSEYHTYCLSPPLARIPEGNWYCPSCVAGQSKVQESSNQIHVMSRQRRKRYQGEDTRMFLEALNQLAVIMEEKEYWELTVEERIFLLKFLCDEVLNSVVIHEHLEQCADLSNDLQQKLRSLSLEWRNLKLREDMLAARNVMEARSKMNGTGDLSKEGITNLFANHGRWMGQPQNLGNRPSYPPNFVADPQQRTLNNMESGLQENVLNDFTQRLGHLYLKSISEKCLNSSRNEKWEHCNSSSLKLTDLDYQLKDGSVNGLASSLGNNLFPVVGLDESNRQNGQPLSVLTQPDRGESKREEGCIQTKLADVENSAQSNLSASNGPNSFSMADVAPRSHFFLDVGKAQLGERGLSAPFGAGATTQTDGGVLGGLYNVHPDIGEVQHDCNLEAVSVKKEILLLQESISSVESELIKVSLRREFLGRDSFGRLYWIFGRPGKRPWLVVDGSQPRQWKRTNVETNASTDIFGGSTSRYSALVSGENIAASNGGQPDLDPCRGLWNYQWVSYESDSEIQELVSWLKVTGTKDKELIESILHWQRFGFRQSNVRCVDESQVSLEASSGEKAATHSLVTGAAAILEKRFGPCLEAESNDIPRKRGRKWKASNDERMYRCECLEPVWPSRYHCVSCHQTFCTSAELDGHGDGRCNTSSQGSDDGKDNENTREVRGTKPEIAWEKDVCDDADAAGSLKRVQSYFSSKLVKFQKRGATCPFNFDDICSKLITKDSNKELVKEIGLLGSNGEVSLVTTAHTSSIDQMLTVGCYKIGEAELSPIVGADNDPVLASTLDGMGDSVVQCHDNPKNSTPPTSSTPQQCLDNGNDLPQRFEGWISDKGNDGRLSSSNDKTMEMEHGQSCIIPEMSLRPLCGKVSQNFRRLKIHLLDMDAALPEEAVKPSKAHLSNRCLWRAFVKSSESIYEMIQATITFENLIRTEYLKSGWWFWSSLTAAARTRTVSALALRIYALDAAIIYQKGQASMEPADCQKAVKSGKKKKKDTDG